MKAELLGESRNGNLMSVALEVTRHGVMDVHLTDLTRVAEMGARRHGWRAYVRMSLTATSELALRNRGALGRAVDALLRYGNINTGNADHLKAIAASSRLAKAVEASRPSPILKAMAAETLALLAAADKPSSATNGFLSTPRAYAGGGRLSLEQEPREAMNAPSLMSER